MMSYNPRKRRRMGILAALTVPALIAGVYSTSASFTDTEKVSDNQITAGVFDILVTQTEMRYGPMDDSRPIRYLEPSEMVDPPTSETSPGFTISDQGNLNKRIHFSNLRPGDLIDFTLDVENVGTITADWEMTGTATYTNGACVDQGDGAESAGCVGVEVPLNIEINQDLITPVGEKLTSSALYANNVNLAPKDNTWGGLDVHQVHFIVMWDTSQVGEGNNSEGSGVTIDLVFSATPSA